MDKVSLNKAIENIADCFGYEDQSHQLVEEMAELTVAVNKLRRAGKSHVSKQADEKYQIALDNVKEEIADVHIMLIQIIHLLDIPKEELEAMITFKVNRTKERIAQLNNK